VPWVHPKAADAWLSLPGTALGTGREVLRGTGIREGAVGTRFPFPWRGRAVGLAVPKGAEQDWGGHLLSTSLS